MNADRKVTQKKRNLQKRLDLQNDNSCTILIMVSIFFCGFVVFTPSLTTGSSGQVSSTVPVGEGSWPQGAGGRENTPSNREDDAADFYFFKYSNKS